MQINVEHAKEIIAHLRYLQEHNLQHKFNMKGYLSHEILKKDPNHTGFYKIADLKEYLSRRKIYEPISATEYGTVADLAGHIALYTGADKTMSVPQHARDWLGLTYEEGRYLFCAHWTTKEWEEITLDEVIVELESLIKSASA